MKRLQITLIITFVLLFILPIVVQLPKYNSYKRALNSVTKTYAKFHEIIKGEIVSENLVDLCSMVTEMPSAYTTNQQKLPDFINERVNSIILNTCLVLPQVIGEDQEAANREIQNIRRDSQEIANYKISFWQFIFDKGYFMSEITPYYVIELVIIAGSLLLGGMAEIIINRKKPQI
jgi:hypothetical protein